jgi:hypothetical protein
MINTRKAEEMLRTESMQSLISQSQARTQNEVKPNQET